MSSDHIILSTERNNGVPKIPRSRFEIESLRTSWMINHAHYLDDFFGMIVEGRQRIGKSSYCCQCLAEAHGEWSHWEDRGVQYTQCVKPEYDSIKKWVVFPPKDFIGLVLEIPMGEKEKAVYWSDAGFWLFALDWYDPFVKTVAKYIQLSGRQFGGIFFSTPNKKLISSKVLESMPEIYVCRIHKQGVDTRTYKPRLAKIYEKWDYPDGRKGGVKTRWKDKYNAILPNDFWGWYKPESDRYMDVGKRILEREYDAMQRKLSKREKEDQMEDVHKAVGSPERIKEIEEVLAMYPAQ